MEDIRTLKTRLDEIDEKIRRARRQLKLTGLFDKDHRATADELTRRNQLLREMLDSEVATLAAQGRHINSFQKTVLIWLNRVGFDR